MMVMSDDGAHLGKSAEEAMHEVLGGESEEKAAFTPLGMQQHLTRATIDDCDNYDGTARYAGKLILAYLTHHPEHAFLPASGGYVYEKERRAEGDEGKQVGPVDDPVWSYRVGVDLYTEVKQYAINLHMDNYDKCLSQLTGYMWGWAVNAARYALDLPPTPNPAIVTINTP